MVLVLYVWKSNQSIWFNGMFSHPIMFWVATFVFENYRFKFVVAGIDVGHQFFSRAEMVVVGFHNHWLNGIDYVGQTAGKKGVYNWPLSLRNSWLAKNFILELHIFFLALPRIVNTVCFSFLLITHFPPNVTRISFYSTFMGVISKQTFSRMLWWCLGERR